MTELSTNRTVIQDVTQTVKCNSKYMIARIILIFVLYFTSINKYFLDQNIDIQTLSPIYILYFGPLLLEYCSSYKAFTKVSTWLKKVGISVCIIALISVFLLQAGGLPTPDIKNGFWAFVFRYYPMIMILLSVLDYFFFLNIKSKKYIVACDILEKILNNKHILEVTNKEYENQIEEEIEKYIR